MHTMQKLRNFVKHTRNWWLAVLVPALVFVLCSQLHIHMHEDHLHSHNTHQHSHSNELHNGHYGSTHEGGDALDHHIGLETTVVDVSPDGFIKYLSSILLVLALVSTFILFFTSLANAQRLKRHNSSTPLLPWRRGLSPLLRAPPL